MIHPVQAWLRAMQYFLDRAGEYRHTPIEDLRTEFVCASRQLRLGWSLISLLKSQETHPTQPDPVNDVWRENSTKERQAEEFNTFWSLAQERILRACRHQKIPFRQPMDLKKLLSLFIKAGKLDNRCSLLMNPLGWQNYKIAPMLFAKSVCLLTLSPHDMTEMSGLSFLLTRLEEALGLMPPGIQWNGKSLPRAKPERR